MNRRASIIENLLNALVAIFVIATVAQVSFYTARAALHSLHTVRTSKSAPTAEFLSSEPAILQSIELRKALEEAGFTLLPPVPVLAKALSASKRPIRSVPRARRSSTSARR